MRNLGIDVHLRMSVVCILDENGKKEKLFTVRGHYSKLLKALEETPKPFAICFEASSSYGFLHGEFSRIATRVVVAHPGQLRLIFRSKRKNDRIDAEKLAKLLFLDEVPPVYVPNLNVREWRDAITYRGHSVDKRTSCKNQIRALPRTHGIEAPKSLWSKRGLAGSSEFSSGNLGLQARPVDRRSHSARLPHQASE